MSFSIVLFCKFTRSYKAKKTDDKQARLHKNLNARLDKYKKKYNIDAWTYSPLDNFRKLSGSPDYNAIKEGPLFFDLPFAQKTLYSLATEAATKPLPRALVRQVIEYAQRFNQALLDDRVLQIERTKIRSSNSSTKSLRFFRRQTRENLSRLRILVGKKLATTALAEPDRVILDYILHTISKKGTLRLPLSEITRGLRDRLKHKSTRSLLRYYYNDCRPDFKPSVPLSFSGKFSPAISRRHRTWLEFYASRGLDGDLKQARYKKIWKYARKGRRARRFLATPIFFNKSLFWSDKCIPSARRIDYVGPTNHLAVATSFYFTRKARLLHEALRRCVNSIFKKRFVPRFDTPYVKNRDSSQLVDAAARGFDGLFPWSVNFRRVKKAKYIEKLWDRQKFKLRNFEFSAFFDDKLKLQLFSEVVNSVTARAVDLRIFGKLLNTHFSNRILSAGSEIFLNNSVSNKTHPDLEFYNPTNTSFSHKKSNSLSGFFPHFSDNLVQEYAHPALSFIKSSATLGWDRQTEFLAAGDTAVDRKRLSYNQKRNDAFYATNFNRYWNINFHKYNNYGLSRNNFRMFGMHMMTSNFLLNFESSVESNFNNFYSCNKVSTIKMLNSLITASELTDTRPKFSEALSVAFDAYHESQELFAALKNRSKWNGRSRLREDYYKIDSVLVSSLASSQPYHTATLRRLRALVKYSFKKFCRKIPSERNFFNLASFYEEVKSSLVNRRKLTPPFLLHLSKIFPRLALLRASRATSPVINYDIGDFDAPLVEGHEKVLSYKQLVALYRYKRRLRAAKKAAKKVAASPARARSDEELINAPLDNNFVRNRIERTWTAYRDVLDKPLFYKFVGGIDQFQKKFFAAVEFIRKNRTILDHKIAQHKYSKAPAALALLKPSPSKVRFRAPRSNHNPFTTSFLVKPFEETDANKKKHFSYESLRVLSACGKLLTSLIKFNPRRIRSSSYLDFPNYNSFVMDCAGENLPDAPAFSRPGSGSFSDSLGFAIKRATKSAPIWSRPFFGRSDGMLAWSYFANRFATPRRRRAGGKFFSSHFKKSNLRSKVFAGHKAALKYQNLKKMVSAPMGNIYTEMFINPKSPLNDQRAIQLINPNRHVLFRKVLNTRGSRFSSKLFFNRIDSKAISFNFLRFSLADHLARTMGELKNSYILRYLHRSKMRKAFRNVVRFNKEVILRKKDVEAKGRSVFVYYPQKKNWYQRKWNRPYSLMAAVSTAAPYSYDAKLHALVSVYGFRKFAAVRRRARAKHYRQKVFIKKILRRKFACNMSSLHTRWRLAKQTKRKWYKYFDEFEGKLCNFLCLVGYFDNLEASTDAISFGAVRVNNSFCTNPDYRIRPLDVISLDMQTYLEIRSTRLFNLVNTHLAKPDVTLDVKRRVLGDAAEFLKKYSSVARLRGEGYSVTKFLFFKNLLSATVTKIKDRKKKLYTRRKLDKKAKTARKRPFFKKPRSGAGQGPLLRPNYYSKGDLGSGVAYEKISVNPASSPSDAFYTPSKIRRLLLRALKGDAAGLSSSIPTANDIFYQFNNIVIYLRRPHTINEMFEKSSIKTSATYNSEVIEEFYTSRFWK